MRKIQQQKLGVQQRGFMLPNVEEISLKVASCSEKKQGAVMNNVYPFPIVGIYVYVSPEPNKRATQSWNAQ